MSNNANFIAASHLLLDAVKAVKPTFSWSAIVIAVVATIAGIAIAPQSFLYWILIGALIAFFALIFKPYFLSKNSLLNILNSKFLYSSLKSRHGRFEAFNRCWDIFTLKAGENIEKTDLTIFKVLDNVSYSFFANATALKKLVILSGRSDAAYQCVNASLMCQLLCLLTDIQDKTIKPISFESTLSDLQQAWDNLHDGQTDYWAFILAYQLYLHNYPRNGLPSFIEQNTPELHAFILNAKPLSTK